MSELHECYFSSMSGVSPSACPVYSTSLHHHWQQGELNENNSETRQFPSGLRFPTLQPDHFPVKSQQLPGDFLDIKTQRLYIIKSMSVTRLLPLLHPGFLSLTIYRLAGDECQVTAKLSAAGTSTQSISGSSAAPQREHPCFIQFMINSLSPQATKEQR